MITGKIEIKPYRNGVVINESRVKQGNVMDIVKDSITEKLSEIYGSRELPIGDERLNKEFTVEINIIFK